MDDMIENYEQAIKDLRESRLPQEVVAPQIQYFEDCIFEMERIDELCRVG